MVGMELDFLSDVEIYALDDLSCGRLWRFIRRGGVFFARAIRFAKLKSLAGPKRIAEPVVMAAIARSGNRLADKAASSSRRSGVIIL